MIEIFSNDEEEIQSEELQDEMNKSKNYIWTTKQKWKKQEKQIWTTKNWKIKRANVDWRLLTNVLMRIKSNQSLKTDFYQN